MMLVTMIYNHLFILILYFLMVGMFGNYLFYYQMTLPFMWKDNIGSCCPIFRKSFIVISVRLSISVESGGRLNKKDGLTRYGDSHVKDMTS